MRWVTRLGCLVGVALLQVGCGGGASEPCDAAALRDALASAAPGDTVTMGTCRIEGSVTVPAGVVLAGHGASESRIAPTDDASVAVWLEPGDPAAQVRDVTIEGTGVAGVATNDETCASRRPGKVVLTDVDVEAAMGVGVFLGCVEEAELTRVSVRGGIDADNVTTIDPMANGQDGVDLLHVGDAALEDVEVTGLSRFGLLALDSTMEWNGGSAAQNLEVGVFSSSSTAVITAVDVSDNLHGFSLIPTYGIVASDGSRLSTTDVHVDGNDGYGILDVASSSAHDGLVVRDNASAGVWVAQSTSFHLSGGDIGGNAFAGVLLRSCAEVAISDTDVTATRLSPRVVGETGLIHVGDGLQILETPAGLTLDRVLLEDNERVGLLLGMGAAGDVPDAMFTDVTVRTTGSELGAMAGARAACGDAECVTPVAPGTGGWDDGITREGTAAANDAAFADDMEVAGIIGPSDIPAPETIGGIIGPSD